ncbi:replication initiation protein RepC, partial [Herbaspirillum sp. HC18]
GRAGEIELAFGFDLSPLVVRSEEFENLAAEIEAEARALKLVRERITLCRRDIAKMIATGIEEGVPTRREGQGPTDWQEVHAAFRSIVDGIPRTATRQELEPIAEELSRLADDVLNLLEAHIKSQNPSANESHSERHIQNSNTDPFIDLEPSLREGR